MNKIPLLWRLLPSVGWEQAEGSPLGQVLKESSSSPGAILLGNPEQAGRRALVLTSGKSPMVVKIGVGTTAADLVTAEGDFIERESKDCVEMSALKYRGKGDHWAAFGVSYLEGASVRLPDLCTVLESWLEDQVVPFGELPSSKLLRDSPVSQAAGILASCEKLQLRPSRVHGDLAPWNVRQDATGHLRMIDWEEGRVKDVPCWDLVHFFFQQAVLVNGLDSRAAQNAVTNSLKLEPARALLKRSGWGGRVNLLLASYLIGMATEDLHVVGILENLDYESIA